MPMDSSGGPDENGPLPVKVPNSEKAASKKMEFTEAMTRPSPDSQGGS